MIKSDLIQQYGGHLIEHPPKSYVFHEGGYAGHYHQLKEGVIKMVNQTGEKDFIQGIFFSGDSFGEPPLFGDFPYPSSAIVIQTATVWHLSKESFFCLLKDTPPLLMRFTVCLANRLRYKSRLLQNITCMSAAQQVEALLNYFANQHKGALEFEPSTNEAFHTPLSGIIHPGAEHPFTAYLIPFTRRQLADMLGLRSETVIRIIREFHTTHRAYTHEHKLYWRPAPVTSA